MKFSDIHTSTRLIILISLASVAYLFYQDYQDRNYLYYQVEKLGELNHISGGSMDTTEVVSDTAHLNHVIASLEDLEEQVIALQNQSMVTLWWDKSIEAIDKLTPLLLLIIPMFYERIWGRERTQDPANT